MKYLRPRVFKGLNKLRILSLHTNNMSSLPNGIFYELPNLREINLISNQLQTINKCAFRDVRRLRKIVVQGNPIMCTCNMQWTMATMGPTVVGMCDGPSQMEGDDITNHRNYIGCQVEDEYCPKLPGQM